MHYYISTTTTPSMHAIINQSVEYNLRVENTPKHKKKKKPERTAICYFTAISAADDARNGCLLATLICHSPVRFGHAPMPPAMLPGSSLNASLVLTALFIGVLYPSNRSRASAQLVGFLTDRGHRSHDKG